MLVVRGDCCLGDGSVLSALSDHVSDVRSDDEIEKAIAYTLTRITIDESVNLFLNDCRTVARLNFMSIAAPYCSAP